MRHRATETPPTCKDARGCCSRSSSSPESSSSLPLLLSSMTQALWVGGFDVGRAAVVCPTCGLAV